MATPGYLIRAMGRLVFFQQIRSLCLFGVILGFGGIVIMIGPDALAGLGANVLAQTAIVGATVSYAFAGIFGKRFRGIPPYIIAAGQLTSTTIMMIPVALCFDHPWLLPLPGLKTCAALLGLGLLSTSVAYVIYFRLLSSAGVTNLLLVTFLIPASALFLGMSFFIRKIGLSSFHWNDVHWFGPGSY